jgi:hypothetical protein
LKTFVKILGQLHMKKAKWPGEWKVVCDVCGFQFPSGEVKKRWDNLIVCKKDWEMRHPQDFLRQRPENTTPAFVRSPPADVFVSVTYPFALDPATH